LSGENLRFSAEQHFPSETAKERGVNWRELKKTLAVIDPENELFERAD